MRPLSADAGRPIGSTMAIHEEVSMKVRMSAMILFAGVVWAAPALANWSLGTSLGMSVVTQEEGDNLILFSVPGGSPLLFPGLQPGLRISSVNEAGGTEFFVDASMIHLSSSGDGITSFTGTANLLQPFSRSASVSQYVTMGAAWFTPRTRARAPTTRFWAAGSAFAADSLTATGRCAPSSARTTCPNRTAA
jgi:hypothetical protein